MLALWCCTSNNMPPNSLQLRDAGAGSTLDRRLCGFAVYSSCSALGKSRTPWMMRRIVGGVVSVS